MRLSVADVLDRLQAEGLAGEAARAPARAALQEELREHVPWFIRLATALGAWFATGFLLASLLAIASLDEPVPRLVAGLVLVAAAVWLRRAAATDFRQYVAVATSLAGQGLVIASVAELTDSPRATAMVALLMILALVRFMPDWVHRFLSALAFAPALFVALVDEDSALTYEVVTVTLAVLAGLVWRFRVAQRDDETTAMLEPAGYALVAGLFGAILVGTSTHLGRLSFDPGPTLRAGTVTTIGLTLLLLALAWLIREEQGGAEGPARSFAALTGVAVLGATTLSTPGIVAGAAVLTLAFDRRDRVLLSLGVAFLLVFGTVYYYSMHLTLLEKSGVLAGSGVLLLGIRQRLVRQ